MVSVVCDVYPACPPCRCSGLGGSGGPGSAAQRAVGSGQVHPDAVGHAASQRLEHRLSAVNPGGAHWYFTSGFYGKYFITDLKLDSISGK